MTTTIAAVSSPPGPGRRGILRLSGPRTRELVNAALASPGPSIDPRDARRVLRGRLDDGRGTQPVVVFWMPGPRSYTREDVAELHLPGAPPLVDCAFARLLALGAQAAAAGEFTRRAFLNGRIDLSRAEGVLGLVEAAGEAERRAATRLLDGGLERRVSDLREALDDARALCEASLDFDEADTGHVPTEELDRALAAAAAGLDEAVTWEVLRQPPSALPRAFLHGAPNAGKSSLLNALVPASAALVSEHPGTTRDTLSAVLDLDAGPVLLLDGPGLEEATRGPMATAQRLAGLERRAADLVVWVVDATRATPERLAADCAALPEGVPRVVAWNQVDRAGAQDACRPAWRAVREGACGVVAVSAARGDGLAELRVELGRALGGGASPVPGEGRALEAGGLGRELFARHRRALEEARAELARARGELGAGQPLDLVAETLREATRRLDRISGATGAEDLLDRIFARFCVGK